MSAILKMIAILSGGVSAPSELIVNGAIIVYGKILTVNNEVVTLTLT